MSAGDQARQDGRHADVVLPCPTGRSVDLAHGRTLALPRAAQRDPRVFSSGKYTLRHPLGRIG